MPIITSTDIKLLRAPLLQPFRTSLGVHKELENILFRVTLANGICGYGEAAIAPHITGETIAGTFKSLETAKSFCDGKRVEHFVEISNRLHREFPGNPAAIAAVETALLDAFTRDKKIPLWRYFGKTAHALKTDITLVLCDLAQTQRTVRKFYRWGFRMFKVKIGHDLDLDVKRLLAIKTLAPRSRIIVDANQGYTVGETMTLLNLLKKHKVRIDLLEQPVAKGDWEGLREISRSASVLVCADESVGTLESARNAVKFKLAPVFNIKIMKCGLLHAGEIAHLARKNRVRLMIGGMMESSIAMTASAHLAAGLGCFDFIDLDTPFFIKGAPRRHPYLSSDGRYDVKKVKAGIGIGPGYLYDQ
ncbi:MAG TPA: dipeptide epimerase [Candidatus Omnitrophota bacterium]|nr:dipeptide epimerase [Candidatus Omnitrophota bacterium]